MGLFDRFLSKGVDKRAREARDKELDGELASAARLYEEAGLPDDAARVLMLRADAAGGAEQRIALLARAAELASNADLKRSAAGRRALAAFDVLRGHGAAVMKSELLEVARALEESGELEPAADAFALAGDADGEVRALTAAGAIERLEDRLRASASATREQRGRELLLKQVADLDRMAERRAALELATTAPEDERVCDMARAIRARLARGPIVDLELDGVARRYALGAELTIGRGDATIVVGAPAISRRHVRVFRGDGGEAFVEDLGTRNGTWLAGARLTGPIPIGAGVVVALGGDVPVSIAPLASARAALVSVEVAGVVVAAPLGDLAVDGWRIGFEPSSIAADGREQGARVRSALDLAFVILRAPAGEGRPYLGEYQLADRVELCVGDELRAARGGPVRLRVAPPRAIDETGDPPVVGHASRRGAGA